MPEPYMMAYAEENGLEFTGPVYNTYLFDELCIVDPNEYLLQASAMVTEKDGAKGHYLRRQLA